MIYILLVLFFTDSNIKDYIDKFYPNNTFLQEYSTVNKNKSIEDQILQAFISDLTDINNPSLLIDFYSEFLQHNNIILNTNIVDKMLSHAKSNDGKLTLNQISFLHSVCNNVKSDAVPTIVKHMRYDSMSEICLSSLEIATNMRYQVLSNISELENLH